MRSIEIAQEHAPDKHPFCIGWPSYALLFLLMAFPLVLQLLYLKVILFLLVIGATAYEFFVNGRARLSGRLGLWSVALAAASFFFVIEGMLAGAPGASKMALVYVVWPLVYTVWIAGLAQRRFLLGVHNTTVLATLFIGVYGSLFLLTQLRVIPGTRIVSWLSFSWESEGFGEHDGYTQLQFAGLNSLAFLLPYVMASIATQLSSARRTLLNLCLWIACVLSCLVMLAAGRRALFLVVFVSPLLILLFRAFLPMAEKKSNRRSLLTFCAVFAVLMVLLFSGLQTFYQFDLASMWEHFVAGFDLSSQTFEYGSAERHQELVALLKGWMDHPIFGVGHGASAFGSIRSETMPWAYELSYVALLFHTGIVGFAAYATGVAWIFCRGIWVLSQGGWVARIMLPMLVGAASMLIANATNPYLARFDGLWVLFLPLAVINYRLSSRSGENPTSTLQA